MFREKGVCTCEWIRLGMDGSETTMTSEGINADEVNLKFHYTCTNQYLLMASSSIVAIDTVTLTLEDVGCRIKLVYTPVRKDGVTGAPQTVVSDIVIDGIYLFVLSTGGLCR